MKSSALNMGYRINMLCSNFLSLFLHLEKKDVINVDKSCLVFENLIQQNSYRPQELHFVNILKMNELF